VRFEWEEGAADRDPLVLRWGYRGQELQPLFDGTVLRTHLRETFKVWGLCRARALADTRITRTYQEEAAGAVVNHLVAALGFSSLDVAPCDLVIDKLPLRNSTVVQALTFLNRRLELDRAFVVVNPVTRKQLWTAMAWVRVVFGRLDSAAYEMIAS
jgi:hypothetical protein